VTTTPSTSPRRVFALIPAAIAIIAALNLHIPYFTLSPGPVEDVGALTTIEGAETYETEGVFMLTTVRLRSVTVAEALRGLVDRHVDVIPRDVVLGERTEEEQDRVQTEQMEQSQLFAKAAALDFLGYDVHISTEGARVMSVHEDAPASGVLRAGDVIVAADGQEVTRTEDLVEIVDQRSVGDEVELELRRDDDPQTVTVSTIGRDTDPDRPMIGILVESVIGEIELPISVKVDAGRIGGPSAGLMFALNLVEALDPEDLAQGRTIVGTGVISLDGEVGPVGGVPQKIAAARAKGADLFLVPERTFEAACAVAGDLLVIGVESLADAVASLRDQAVAEQRSCP
jgi:Lon-like protease